ncbi:MAG: D-serine deaminase-like pyridoxal phosphate-dependent protein [Maribacter sp.]|jgi:D-serine deaminase-like pyridoxal phosphate-dependent protein
MTYSYYSKLFKGEKMPFAYLDKDLLDQNIKDILVRSGRKKIRVASKSVRCKWALRYILEQSEQLQGIMCYTAEEAVWLANEGFDDLLIAYPTFHPEQVKSIIPALKSGKTIYLMTDLDAHLTQLDKIAKAEGVQIPICLDMDMTSRFPGIYFGVYRSSVHSLDDAKRFFEKLKTCQHLRLGALMGYEAQIAGLGDNIKGKAAMNSIVRFLKRKSVKEIAKRRKAMYDMALEYGHEPEVVNGGGTGSLETTREEECVTEVTVGSGFFSSHLFDNYKVFKHKPAAGYAIEIVRQPQEHIYTCLGGGYVASGPFGIDKVPHPHLPKGAELLKDEMAGEVQTPIIYKGNEKLELGNPIFMRHSKAGELCKHFKELIVVSEGKIEQRVDTYRGEGMCFL